MNPAYSFIFFVIYDRRSILDLVIFERPFIRTSECWDPRGLSSEPSTSISMPIFKWLKLFFALPPCLSFAPPSCPRTRSPVQVPLLYSQDVGGAQHLIGGPPLGTVLLELCIEVHNSLASAASTSTSNSSPLSYAFPEYGCYRVISA